MLSARKLLLYVLSLVSPVLHAQQPYPNKPIRFLVGFAPGGGSDILARALATPLSETLGQPVTVDNRAGAGGMIAAELTAKAPADGYTLLLGSAAAFAINPNLMTRLSYDPVKDFTPVGTFATFFSVVCVNPSLPVRSIKELIALAKARPGEINFGTAGTGSQSHLAIEQFLQMAGIKMTHVPYKGGPMAMTALLSGDVAMVFDVILTAVPLVKSGRVRALAVTMSQRSPRIPDVPTVAEAGVKGFESGNWFSVFAPAGTPRSIVEQLNAAINKIMARPDVKENLLSQGAAPLTGTPEDLAELLRRELSKYASIIRQAGINPETR